MGTAANLAGLAIPIKGPKDVWHQQNHTTLRKSLFFMANICYKTSRKANIVLPVKTETKQWI
jgi:hypothetical protein